MYGQTMVGLTCAAVDVGADAARCLIKEEEKAAISPAEKWYGKRWIVHKKNECKHHCTAALVEKIQM